MYVTYFLWCFWLKTCAKRKKVSKFQENPSGKKFSVYRVALRTENNSIKRWQCVCATLMLLYASFSFNLWALNFFSWSISDIWALRPFKSYKISPILHFFYMDKMPKHNFIILSQYVESKEMLDISQIVLGFVIFPYMFQNASF